ncbi:hypothetical protein HMPREF0322_05144 [Desulfitobacterium hafniense DP7]|uniref:Uncharacterized protein n=1 Tax=Desulfitobacterium hafniense DP7 TaxID=537010 RepID=G9XVW1_DESHA|nr:hypothetical protein [Desulfitobacterium hafniense]EHL04224.1 hypothetical protein HMPREF0322_05144 [Desulfitobacterium hafniense DP7]
MEVFINGKEENHPERRRHRKKLLEMLQEAEMEDELGYRKYYYSHKIFALFISILERTEFGIHLFPSLWKRGSYVALSAATGLSDGLWRDDIFIIAVRNLFLTIDFK